MTALEKWTGIWILSRRFLINTQCQGIHGVNHRGQNKVRRMGFCQPYFKIRCVCTALVPWGLIISLQVNSERDFIFWKFEGWTYLLVLTSWDNFLLVDTKTRGHGVVVHREKQRQIERKLERWRVPRCLGLPCFYPLDEVMKVCPISSAFEYTRMTARSLRWAFIPALCSSHFLQLCRVIGFRAVWLRFNIIGRIWWTTWKLTGAHLLIETYPMFHEIIMQLWLIWKSSKVLYLC